MKRDVASLIVLIVFVPFFWVIIYSCSSGNKREIQSTSEVSTSFVDTLPVYINREKEYKQKHLCVQDFADVEYVILEFLEESLIEDFSHSLTSIRLTDTDIFIGMKFDILHFDRNGKFLNRIGKVGQGPDEYLLLNSFVVDESKKEIIINDAMGYRFFFYKYDGTYVKNIKYEGSVHQIELLDDGLLCCYSSHYGHEPAIALRSLANGEKVKVLSCVYCTPGTHFNGFLITPRKYNGEVYVNTFETDTIFSVNAQRKTPRYIFLPPNGMTNILDCDICTVPFIVCETEAFATIVSISKNGKMRSYIIDKRNNEIYEGSIFDSELDSTIFVMNSGIDNQFVGLIDVSYIHSLLKDNRVSSKLKEIALTLDEEDNPVLMIATIRK